MQGHRVHEGLLQSQQLVPFGVCSPDFSARCVGDGELGHFERVGATPPPPAPQDMIVRDDGCDEELCAIKCHRFAIPAHTWFISA